MGDDYLRDLGVNTFSTIYRFQQSLLSHLTVRFPDWLKTTSPQNVLTLLDPRFLDMNFDEEEVEKIIEDMKKDNVFAGMDLGATNSRGNILSMLRLGDC